MCKTYLTALKQKLKSPYFIIHLLTNLKDLGKNARMIPDFR